MSYRRQIRVGNREVGQFPPAIAEEARALKGILDEFGITADRVQFRRVSAREVRCSASELSGEITMSLSFDRVTLSVPNTVFVAQ